jgi:hypothetical protein
MIGCAGNVVGRSDANSHPAVAERTALRVTLMVGSDSAAKRGDLKFHFAFSC